MQVQAGDFVQRGFDPIQYIKRIPKEQYKSVQTQLTQLMHQYKTQITPAQVSEVFENFQQNNKLLQLTETFMQLNNEINSEVDQEIRKIRQYETQYLADKKQIQDEIDELLEYKKAIQYIIHTKQLLDKQPELSDCLQIKNNKYYKYLSKWPEIAIEFQTIFSKQLNDAYVNLNILSIDNVQTVQQLIQYDFDNYINYVNENFTHKFLDSLFDKYGQVDSTSEKLVNGIDEIFKTYSNAIATLRERNTNNFITIITNEKQRDVLLHKQLIYLIQQIQNHFNTFFASVCYNNNMFLLQQVMLLVNKIRIDITINEVLQHILLKNTLIVFVNYLIQTIDESLETQSIENVLSTIKSAMELYYNYPIANRLKDLCIKQQPCGLFIPSLASELVEQFQRFLKHIPETLQGIIDRESKTSSLYQNKNKFNFTKFKFISQLTSQEKSSGTIAFSLQYYKDNIKKLSQFFNGFNRLEVQEVDYAIEPQIDVKNGFTIYQLYVKTLNEQLELFINNEFKKFVLGYGLG